MTSLILKETVFTATLVPEFSPQSNLAKATSIVCKPVSGSTAHYRSNLG